jgi:hypothetical protein
MVVFLGFVSSLILMRKLVKNFVFSVPLYKEMAHGKLSL